MLKYYIVTEQSKVFEQYWKYDSTLKCIQKAFGSFADEHDIKANKFHTLADRLYIVPEKEDIKRFSQDFVKNNVGMFKKKTLLSNKWIEKCKAEGIKTPNKPFIPFVFNCADRCLWRLFDVDSVIYCTFESEAKFVAPKGFQEIDEKEFYSIMESHNVEILKEIY